MLAVKSLSFSFEHRRLFQDVSFEVPPGTLLHLQGVNGVGKSTFLGILAGIRKQDNGTIEYIDQNQKRYTDIREVSAYLSAEANGLYTKMDAIGNLRFWCQLRGLKPSNAELVGSMETWGLGHPLLRQNFPVEFFSTGMRRRLALARLSLAQASCWLLDEPIYGLDEKGINLFRQHLEKHLDGGGVGVMISHDRLASKGIKTLDYLLKGRVQSIKTDEKGDS